MGKASVKVEGGKMVKVEIEDSEVSVTGDFFIEPAEGREKIESVLSESNHIDEEEILERIEDINAELIGFSARDVLEAFQEARGDQE
jgi:predicted HAD superfamily phosphohydrolase